MGIKGMFLLLVVILIGVFSYSSIENFFDLGSNMIEFTRLDGSLIKKIKVGSSTSIYDQEVLNLFKQDDVIQITIPENYSVKIIYKFRNESKGFGKTIYLDAGSYDISKIIGNKQIFQIDVSNDYGIANGFGLSDLVIRNIDGNIIYTGPQSIPIDWDLIYTNFGYDDYYIYYPSSSTVRTYYYYNYPRYKLYWPSRRIQREKYNSSNWTNNKFYRYKSEYDSNTGDYLMEPPQRITVTDNNTNNVVPVVRGKGQLLDSNANPLIRGKGQWLVPAKREPKKKQIN